MAAIIREERESDNKLCNPLHRDNEPSFSDDEDSHSKDDEDDIPLCA